MTQVETSMARSDVRPFSVDVPEEDLVELRRRVQAVRWPEKETVTDRTFEITFLDPGVQAYAFTFG